MKHKSKLRMVAWLLSLLMVFTIVPSIAFADDEQENQAPVLSDEVDPEASGQVVKGMAYLLGDLQDGKIFVDPDGDKLDYKKNIFYQRSTDRGETWGEPQDFDSDTYQTTISLTENKTGVYFYRFWAVDDKGASSADNDEYWMLTLNVVDEGIWATKFYVGKDWTGKQPELALYKTAGVNNDIESPQYNYDYVGTFNKGNEVVFVYDPADYIITGDAKTGWKIQETADGPEYDLMNYEPVEFTNDPETETPSGTIIDMRYAMYYASIKGGWYSYRGYSYDKNTGEYSLKLGGMKLKIPTNSNVDGTTGGGTEIYLRGRSLYTTSKKTDGTFFNEDEYHAAVVCPIMECNVQSGTPYKSGKYAYYPFLLYAGGNSCLYNYYMYPDIDGYIFSVSSNATIKPDYTEGAQSISIGTAVELSVNAPQDADFGLFFQFNNFNTREVEPIAEPVMNDDGTKTIKYHITKSSQNYTWRLEDPSGKYVTKAGWLGSAAGDSEVSFSFDEDSPTDKKSHDFSRLGSTTNLTDEADIQVGLDSTGFLAMDEDAKKRVRAYRMWEIVNSVSANIMIEPDFHWQIISGKADIDLVSGGNTSDNWADIDPEGTAIIAVSYDALEVFNTGSTTEYSGFGGYYPSTNMNRTGVIVMSDTEKGQAVANIRYNRNAIESVRPDYWDYNYESWYYLKSDDKPYMDFTVDGDEVSKVEYSLVTTSKTLKSKMTAWRTITPDKDGKYLVDLNGFRDLNADGGTVMIRMTDKTGVSYCLARVAECEAFADNATKPGEAIEPGDEVNLTFDGLYRALNKQAGIFNPTAFELRYSSGDDEVAGTISQYRALDTAVVKLKVPEDIEFPEGKDETTYEFTNGYVFGQMFSDANPFRYVYEMLDTGVGTNFNAVTVKLCFQRLADVPIKVVKHTSVGMKISVTDGEKPIEGVELTVKDPAGNEIEPVDGKYEDLSYGTYTYTARKDGFVTKSGKLVVSSSDEVDSDKCVNKTIELQAIGEGEWDGETLTEPAKDGSVYQIGTAEELAWFADAVNSGAGASYNAKLTADIDLSGREWTPIGTSSKNYKGSFDGDGHTVKGLHIDVTGTAQADVQYKGLFGFVKGASATKRASIKNLTVKGSVHATFDKNVSNAYIGGICGNAYYADLEDLIADVDVSVEPITGNWNYIGGVAGYVYDSNMSRCLNIGDVTGVQYVGGVAGYIRGEVMELCANYGTVTGSGDRVGGVAGTLLNNNSSITMKNCYNIGNVNGTGKLVGGILGYSSQTAAISNIYNAGTLKSQAGNNVGMIIGEVTKNVTVTNAYSTKSDDLPLFGAVEETGATAEGEFVTAKELSSAAFLKKLNGEDDAFVAGEKYPVLFWLSDWEAEKPCDHKLKKHKAVKETCLEDGSIEFWQCEFCEKCFTDAEGKNEIDEADTVIKAHGLKKVLAVKPSCTEDGHNEYYQCKDDSCGKCYKDAEGKEETTPEDEVIPAAGHVLKKMNTVPATFEEEGTASWICEACGEMFADPEGKVEINSPAKIAKLDKAELEFTEVKYNGEEQKPEVTVTDADENTVDPVNFTVTYDEDCNSVGTHKAEVTFKNNYSGTKELEYKITPLETTVDLEFTEAKYNGKDQKPEVTVTDENKKVLDPDEFVVEYEENCKDAGKHTVKVTPSDNYIGGGDFDYEITPLGATSKLAYTKTTFDGQEHKPAVTAKDENGSDVDPANFTAEYDENCKAGGSHKVKVSFKGNYKGSEELEYDIAPIKASVKLDFVTAKYNGKDQKPGITVKDVSGNAVDPSEYSVKYDDNCKDVGRHSAKVTFSSSYYGAEDFEYEIVPMKTSAKLAYTTATYNGKEKKPAVTVTDEAGVEVDKVDYEVIYDKDSTSAGPHKATVTFRAGCSENIELAYKVNPPKTGITGFTAKQRKLTVKWTSKKNAVTGYQIRYSKKKSSKGGQTLIVAKNTAKKATIGGLKENTKYYFSIRTYKIVNDVTYYSGWSKVKSKKTKKAAK